MLDVWPVIYAIFGRWIKERSQISNNKKRENKQIQKKTLLSVVGYRFAKPILVETNESICDFRRADRIEGFRPYFIVISHVSYRTDGDNFLFVLIHMVSGIDLDKNVFELREKNSFRNWSGRRELLKLDNSQ